MRPDQATRRAMPVFWPLMRSVAGSAPLLFLLLLGGCSSGVIVHDEIRAAELVVDFLAGFKSADDVRKSYEWTDNRYKREVSLAEFSRMVALVRDKNQAADIRLNGYEVFGPVETIIVYASSEVSEGKMYFRLILTGSKSKDYYLLKLDIADSEFDKKGIYRDYAKPVLVRGI